MAMKRKEKPAKRGQMILYLVLLADGAAAADHVPLELIQACYDSQEHAHVLCQRLHFLRGARKGLAQNAGRTGR